MSISARVFEVVQYEFAPGTNTDLHFNENNILSALEHKSIKQWAYIRHDKDVYTEEEELTSNGVHVAGTPRNAHWHCVCKCERAIDLDVIARWFGVPVNCIEIGRGRNAFEEKINYLTHHDERQLAKGKHRYDDSEVIANFDWVAMLETMEYDRIKYGARLSNKDKYRAHVLFDGWTLKQCRSADPINYMNDLDKLKKLRLQYINDMKPPTSRISYYIYGRGGVGKGLCSMALARSLFPQLENDEDIFFVVGGQNATFDGYDGQPVIIWDDCRAAELLKCCRTRGNLFNIFDTHPKPQLFSIKYGVINLCNVINIVNSVADYETFLDELAALQDGVSEHGDADKGQAWRRFPMIIPLHEDCFDLMINRGFIEDSKAFREYIEYKGIRGNLQKIVVACGANTALAKELQTKALKIATDQHQVILNKANSMPESEDAIRDMFADVGTIPGDND